MPSTLYEGPVSEEILSSEVFSTQGIQTIPASSWAAMTHNSDPDNPRYQALLPCYIPAEDGSYRLADSPSYTTQDLMTALLVLEAEVAQQQDLFGVFPSDPAGANRLILLTQDQMDILTASTSLSDHARLSGCFEQIVDTTKNETWFFQKPDLSVDERTLVLSSNAESLPRQTLSVLCLCFRNRYVESSGQGLPKTRTFRLRFLQ